MIMSTSSSSSSSTTPISMSLSSSSSSRSSSSSSSTSLVSLCRYVIILFSTVMGFTLLLSYHQYKFVISINKNTLQQKNNTIETIMIKRNSNVTNSEVNNRTTTVNIITTGSSTHTKKINNNIHNDYSNVQQQLQLEQQHTILFDITDSKQQHSYTEGTMKIISSKEIDKTNSSDHDDIKNNSMKKKKNDTKKRTKTSMNKKIDKEKKEKKKKVDSTARTKANSTLIELNSNNSKDHQQQQQKLDTTKKKESSKTKSKENQNKQYNFDIETELFHVTHPITNKKVISRYGYNYKNRTQRFPSITQRIILYMSNWYLPACTINDISSIHYSSQFYSMNSTTGSSSTNTTKTTNVTNENSSNSTTTSSSIETERRSATERITKNNNNNNKSSVNTIPYIRVSSAIIPEKYDNDSNGNTVITPQEQEQRLEWDFNNIVQPDTVFFIDSNLITIAATNTSNSFVLHYSTDVNETILQSMKRLDTNNNNNKNKTQTVLVPVPPILIEFGDRVTCSYHNDRKKTVNNVPLLRKFRTAIISDIDRYNIAMNNETTSAATNSNDTSTINCTSKQRYHSINNTKTLQPIIWKLNSIRHYSKITDGEIDNVDTIPYSQKNNSAIFRGAMTGPGVSDVWDPRISNFDICYRTPRCRLVMMYADNSTFSNSNTNSNNNTTTDTTIVPSYTIEAKLTKRGGSHDNHPWIIDVPINYTYENNFPLPYNSIAAAAAAATNPTTQQKFSNITNHTTQQINLLGKIVSIQDIVSNKIIIILEGNDVSSGLKWAMYSQCVVLMPYPVITTSWAMEELLEPYIHFVPIYQNLSNIHEQIQWILTHNKEAQYISYRSTLWIKDLLFYPTDDQLIQDEILTRYQSNFFYNESLLLS